MHEVFPPYRAVLGPGLAIEPRVPQNCTRTSPPLSLLRPRPLWRHDCHPRRFPWLAGPNVRSAGLATGSKMPWPPQTRRNTFNSQAIGWVPFELAPPGVFVAGGVRCVIGGRPGTKHRDVWPPPT
jgi:hypothetical protein